MPEKETIAVRTEVMDRFRRAVLEKWGKTFGYLGPEAERALEKYTEKLQQEEDTDTKEE